MKNQKAVNIEEIKLQFQKNFTKSLDHKSFQYKDFMKKHFQIKKLSEMIQKLQYSNINKRHFSQHDIRMLYGASFQSANSDY